MKKQLCTLLALGLIASTSTAYAQNSRPRAPASGVFNGISGSTVAVGVGVAAAITAVALIANSSSNSNAHAH